MSEAGLVIAEPRHEATQIPHNADLLMELELLAKDRYTENDEEYMAVSC